MENYENNFDAFEDAAPDTYRCTEPAENIPAAPADAYKAQHAPDKTPRRSFWRRSTAAVLAVVLVAGSCGLTYSAVNAQWKQKTFLGSAAVEQLNRRIDAVQAQSLADAGGNASVINLAAYEGSMTPRQVYAANAPSVVSISSKVKTTTYTGQVAQATASGSGFILTSDGYVVTNYHVVDGATSISVVLGSGEEYDATEVGHDSVNDVAVLKIEAENLPAVTLGSSDELYIGDMVVAIGNPLGSLSATLTVGYVSGKDRQISTDNSSSINMIQTDAAINAGNSGGPLFNMDGQVVGITTAKYSGNASSGASIEGIGFAIPIDDVMSIIGDLRDYGYVTGAYLGVTVQDTDSELTSKYSLPSGAYVVTVVEGGSADRAGIQPKDIIIGLGDYEVSGVSDLTRMLRKFKAGDKTIITIIRGGERKILDVTLDEKPKDLNASPATVEEQMPQNGSYDEWFKYFFGNK